MNTVQVILGLGCVVLSGALWTSCNSASTERSVLETSLSKASNDWSQAVLQLNEQSALAFTLQTQLKLVKEEHSKVTNSLPQLQADLKSLVQSNSALAEFARSTSNKLQFKVLELSDQLSDAQQHTQNALAAKLSAESREAQLQSLSSNHLLRITQLSNQLVEAKTRIANLDQALRDPANLRSQLQSLSTLAATSPNLNPGSPSAPSKIRLRADGTIETDPKTP